MSDEPQVTDPAPSLLTDFNNADGAYHTHSVPSHQHTISNVPSWMRPPNIETMATFELCDFVVGWRDNKCMILKNRSGAPCDIVSVKRIIELTTKTIARAFLDDKMRLFEEELSYELETAINETLEKEIK